MGFSFSPVTFTSPPATVTGANNGTSLSGANVVLGNNVNDPASPAQLLNIREIVTNGNRVQLIDQLVATIMARMSEQRFTIEEQTNFGFVDMHLTGGTSQINAQSNTAGGDAVMGAGNLTSSVLWQTNGLRPFWNLQNPTTDVQGELVLGVLRIRSASGTGKGLNIDTVGDDVASTGTLSTANPGLGIGKIKMGKIIAAASVIDPNNYWETEVDGVTKKVALIL